MRSNAYKRAFSTLSAAFWPKRKATGSRMNYLLPVLFLTVALCFGSVIPAMAETGMETTAADGTEMITVMD